MGFITGINQNTGRECLACDFCSKIGNVRKIKCPFEYCQAWATCDECKKQGKHKNASTRFDTKEKGINHLGCKIGMEKSDTKEKLIQNVLANKGFIWKWTNEGKLGFRGIIEKIKAGSELVHQWIEIEIPYTEERYEKLRSLPFGTLDDITDLKREEIEKKIIIETFGIVRETKRTRVIGLIKREVLA